MRGIDGLRVIDVGDAGRGRRQHQRGGDDDADKAADLIWRAVASRTAHRGVCRCCRRSGGVDLRTIARACVRWRSSGAMTERSGACGPPTIRSRLVLSAPGRALCRRVHHPGVALRWRVGAGEELSAFRPISWDDALDEVALRFKRAAERYGSETIWPYFYGGTWTLVQRDGIERFRHVLRYSRQHSCVQLANVGYIAGAGILRGVDVCEVKSRMSSWCGAETPSIPRSI